jgi:hypothetical protein
MINGDARLTAAEKTFLINTAFAMKGAKTVKVSLEFSGGRMIQRQDVDGAVNIGTQGTVTFPDAQTMVFAEDCACPPSTFRVTATGDSFTLQIVNPATKEVDALPQRVLFESGPFSRRR